MMLKDIFRCLASLLLLVSTLSIAVALPIHVITTGDIHGALQPKLVDGKTIGGAAEMLACWRSNEDYKPENYLVLSCGDNITSTMPIPMILQGEPVIEVMNDMGYDASAVGNHDFDFSPGRLADWITMANFPFLAANLGNVRNFPAELVKPYLIDESQGVKIGIIGITLPDNLLLGSTEMLSSAAAEETVRRLTGELRKQQVEVIIVISHLPYMDLSALATKVKDLNIPLLIGGHDHSISQRRVANSWVITSGSYWNSYTRIDLDYDRESGKTMPTMAKLVMVQQNTAEALADAALQMKINAWQQQIDTAYNEEIFSSELVLSAKEIGTMLTESWLKGDTAAQIAINNNGSIREQLLPGNITMRHLLGALPFNYQVYRIIMPGKDVIAYLSDKSSFAAGVKLQGAEYQLANGKAIAPKSNYQVLVNSYMYDTSAKLQIIDPKPMLVYEDWRRPLLDRWRDKG